MKATKSCLTVLVATTTGTCGSGRIGAGRDYPFHRPVLYYP